MGKKKSRGRAADAVADAAADAVPDADAAAAPNAGKQRVKAETELYGPVKKWLEARGYTVRGEVRGCDVVGVRDGEPWPVVVELKKRFNLSLFLQAVERLATTPLVYIAAEKSERKNAFAISELRRLCGMLGLGLITVRLYKRKEALVEVHCEPVSDAANNAGWPKLQGRRKAKLLLEFHGRSGDYNAGGTTGRKLVTAYREKALRCAEALDAYGPLAPRQVRDLIASDQAAGILQRNYYGWFERVSRGVYALTPDGAAALKAYAGVLGAASKAGGGAELSRR